MVLLKYLKGYLPQLSIISWLIIIVISILFIFFLKKVFTKINLDNKQTVESVLLSMYVLVFFKSAVLDRTYEQIPRYNLKAFWTLYECLFNGKYFLPEIIGNILITIPFGMLVTMLIIEKKKWHILVTTFCGFILSLMVEISQYILHRGLADIDDVINNVLGTFIGCVLYLIINNLLIYIKNKQSEKKSN